MPLGPPHRSTTVQGLYRSWKTWKVVEFYDYIFQAWKVMEFYDYIFQAWKVMEFYLGVCH